MKSRISYKSKKKLWMIVSSLVFMVVVFGVTLVAVLAATNQSISTNISVTYTSKMVAGSVSATYQVSGGTEMSMKTESGDTALNYDGSEDPGDAKTLAPEGAIILTAQQREVVFKYSWIPESEFYDFIGICESTPGPIAINMATYIGVETGGILGAIISTLGVILPSFAVILVVAKFYAKYKNSFVVKGCLTGLRPVVIGLIAKAIISLGFGVFFPNGITAAAFDFGFFSSVLIFAIVVYLAFKKVNPIYLILGSAGLGIVSGYAEKFLL